MRMNTLTSLANVKPEKWAQPTSTGSGVLSLEDGGFHRREVRMVLCVQTLLFDPAPIAFDQVEVRRIRGQKLQVDAQSPGVGLHQLAPLVASVVQKEGERNVPGTIEGGQLAEQRTDTLGRDVRFVGEEVNLPTDRIQRPQHVEALPSRGRAYKHPCKTPQGTQECAVNKVRGI